MVIGPSARVHVGSEEIKPEANFGITDSNLRAVTIGS